MKESLLSVEVRKGRICRGEDSQPLSDWAVLYEALVVSMRDYINKNGFKGVVLGLSGGVDSALVLKIAVDAVGNDKVLALRRFQFRTATRHLNSCWPSSSTACRTMSLKKTFRHVSAVSF